MIILLISLFYNQDNLIITHRTLHLPRKTILSYISSDHLDQILHALIPYCHLFVSLALKYPIFLSLTYLSVPVTLIHYAIYFLLVSVVLPVHLLMFFLYYLDFCFFI